MGQELPFKRKVVICRGRQGCAAKSSGPGRGYHTSSTSLCHSHSPTAGLLNHVTHVAEQLHGSLDLCRACSCSRFHSKLAAFRSLSEWARVTQPIRNTPPPKPTEAPRSCGFLVVARGARCNNTSFPVEGIPSCPAPLGPRCVLAERGP